MISPLPLQTWSRRASEALEAAFATTCVSICIQRGSDLSCEAANPAFEALLAGEAARGEARASVLSRLPAAGVVATGRALEVRDLAFRRQRPDGALEDAWLSGASIPIHDRDGAVDSVVTLLFDTTPQLLARRSVEELAAEAERTAGRVQAIIETMVEGVVVCDLDGRITLSNESALRILGVSRLEEAEYKIGELARILNVRAPDGRALDEGPSTLMRGLRGEVAAAHDLVVHNRQTDRDVQIRVTGAPVHDAEGRVAGAVAVLRDVTESAELEWLKVQFVSMAAHELKTPATVMKGFSQALLRASACLTPEQRAGLEAIDRGATKLDRIVQELLDLTQLEEGRLELALARVDLSALVGDVVAEAARANPGRPIRLARREPAVVFGAPPRLRYVLSVLIDNAIRFSPGGGDVEVGLSIRDTDALVSVSDQGVGIPTEKQPRIFELFYRAHAGGPFDYGGLGLGLHLARELIAKYHHGRIGFASEEGKGSTFSFALPLARAGGGGAP